MFSKLRLYWQNLQDAGFIPLLNLLLGIFYLHIETTYILPNLSPFDLINPFNAYIYLFMFTTGISSFANFLVFFRTFFSKDLRTRSKNAIIILLLSVWIYPWILVAFAKAPPLLNIVLPIFTASILFIARRHIFSSLLIGLMAVMILITFIPLATSFEWSYCEKQGHKADPNDLFEVVELTEEERKEGYSGNTRLAWRAKRICHKNFNIFSAIIDELNLVQ